MWPTPASFLYLSKRNEILHPYKDMYINIYSSSICHSKKLGLKTIFPSTGEFVLCDLSDKERTADTHFNVKESQNNYAEWKKLYEHILYDFIYI